jgi:hypothetical protein
MKDLLRCLDIEAGKLKAIGDQINNQLHDTWRHQSLRPPISKPPHHQIEKKLRQYKYVRHFSTALYYALERSCREHEKHQAYFRLQPHDTISIGQDPFIEFKLRFSEYHENTWRMHAPPTIWLAIQSPITDATRLLAPETTFGAFERAFKRAKPRPGDPKPLKEAGCLDAPLAPNLQTTMIPGSNLSARGRFCKLMNKHDQETAEDPGLYLGYIETDTSERYRVHFNDAFLTFGRNIPVSLEETLERYFVGCKANSMPYERVELSKQLASAMLQFQATPLLPSVWKATDVVFFGKPRDRLEAHDIFRGPHLNVCINSPSDEENSLDEEDNFSCERFITDKRIFCLAIMFIEIAYQNSLSKLLDTKIGRGRYAFDGFEERQGEAYDERLWGLANRLCDGIIAQLGTRYYTVVRKCLDKCVNSGAEVLRGEDYDAFIYTDVVNELEQLKVQLINEEDNE